MSVLTNTSHRRNRPSDAAPRRRPHPDPGTARQVDVALVASTPYFDAGPPQYGIGFALFLLVNLVLFVRPAELVDGLEDLPIYEVAICACLLASAPLIARQLTLRSLAANPATVFVLGVNVAVVMASLVHPPDLWIARVEGISFMKVFAYFLLVVGLVNSLSRLRSFTLFLFVAVLIMAILVLLEYYGVINIQSMAPMREGIGGDDGFDQIVGRVRGLGIFNDPNDLSLILVLATIIGLHFLAESASWMLRAAWTMPLGLILWAFELTRSRGGFLAMIAAVGMLLVNWLGWRRALIVSVIGCPILIPLMDVRQTNINLSDTNDTAQGRMQIWREAMVLFHHEPMFGLGATRLSEHTGHVAHNSYVQAYAETGFFGGTMFIGAMYLPILMLRQVRHRMPPTVGKELLSWNSTIFAMCLGYMVGMFSLSRNFTIPAYLPSAIAVAYCGLIVARYPGALSYRMNWPLLRKVLIASVGCVALLEVWCRFLVRG
jgi:hypothetical protein